MLSRPDAAAFLGLEIKTLDNWRFQNKGPAYCRLGTRVLYPLSSLERFIAEHTVTPSAP